MNTVEEITGVARGPVAVEIPVDVEGICKNHVVE